MKDLNGVEIKSGDYIIYPALWSRSAILKFGKVLRVNPGKPDYFKRMSTETLTIFGVEFQTCNDIRFVPNRKIVTLKFDYRIVVIPHTAINDEAKNLLDAMEMEYSVYGKLTLKWNEVEPFSKRVLNKA